MAGRIAGEDNLGAQFEEDSDAEDERQSDQDVDKIEMQEVTKYNDPHTSTVAIPQRPDEVDAVAADPPKHNMYVAARGHVQRVIDVALLMNNMSQMATTLKRKEEHSQAQLILLVIALTMSMVAQCIAGVCFFVIHEREMEGKEEKTWWDYGAYACVGIVMVLNVFTTTFGASWAEAT